MTAKPEALFDKRTVKRNIRRGRVTKKEYESFMKKLGDAAEKSVPLFFEEEQEAEENGEPAQ